MITPARAVHFSPAGEEAQPFPGDFFLTVKTGLMWRMISWGMARRFRGDLRKFAVWNHAGFVIGYGGEIIEATHKGVVANNISEYTGREYVIVSPKYDTISDIDQALAFTTWATGKPYGFLTIAGLAVWSLLGGSFDMSLDGTLICSGLVARALERAGYIFDRDPSRVTPGDLARHFDVG